MPDDEKRSLLHEQLDSLRKASQRIAAAMAIIPEQRLVTAIQRGFRSWPHRLPNAVPFLEPVLQTIVDQLRITVRSEIAALGIGRFPHQPFDPWIVSSSSDELRKNMEAPRPVGTLGVVALKGISLRLKDIRTHPDFKGFPGSHPQITSFLAVPIQLDNVTFGSLYTANKIDPEEFSIEDEWVTEIMAQFAGSAIQQMFLQNIVHAQHAQVQTLLDSVPTGVVFVEKGTGNVTANDAAMVLFERNLIDSKGVVVFREQLLGKNGERLEPSELPGVKAMTGQTVLGQELRIRRSDGSIIPVRANAAPVVGDFREVLGAVVIFENISSEKMLEQIRQQTAAMIVHDIRNPIQAAMMNAQAIRKIQSLDPTMARHTELVEINLKRVVNLSERLMEAAQIETAQVKLDLSPVDLGGFIKDVVTRTAGAYPERHIVFQAPGEIIIVKLDLQRMDQVITNLIDNAVKYSPNNTLVELACSIDTNGEIEVSVRDHGPGIESNILESLFEPYKRGSLSHKVAHTGLGLGLFIVKGIIEAHGGTVKVESRLGEGSTFRLHFPSSIRYQIERSA
jgi:signal transduction histidine kinase